MASNMENNMEVKRLLNVSSNPHVRDRITTGKVMYDVSLALMPATVIGIWRFGLHALLVVLMSVLTAVGTEFVFDYVAHKPNSVKDGSAVVTGLLLALLLPPAVPLYVPFVGSLFAILFVKCCFGGLGKNFMNPALAGRCFLLTSFGTVMTKYDIDTITGATPLAVLQQGGTVNLWDILIGNTTGIIGVCFIAVLMGGIYLLLCGHITWHIPVSYAGSFLIALALLAGKGLDVPYLLAELCAGGIALGALFMATDPVTSPMTARGQLIFGVFLGVMTAVFRVFGSSADNVSYIIIIGNLLVPMIDRLPVAHPFGLGIAGAQAAEKKGFSIPKPAMILMAITLVTGAALGGVNALTADTIAAQEAAKAAAAYQEVVPEATSFVFDEKAADVIASLEGGAYLGKDYINEVAVGCDDAGNVVGYGISVTSKEAFDGTLTVIVGILSDGTIQGISFTEINETAGMGMRATEAEWKAQFSGKNVPALVLNKAGGSTEPDQIDSISGASITSGAVVNAVNAALDFFANQLS